MTPIRKQPPGYVAPTIKPRPTVAPAPSNAPVPSKPTRPPRSAESIAREAKHTLKYGQSLPMKKGTGPSAYAVANNIPPAARKPTVSGIPKPAPSGPLVPVHGGGMMPQSQAYTMKKGGTTTLHSITKSSKKSNW